MKFTKYQALGNDYLVIDPADFPYPVSSMETPDQAFVRRVCDRHYGAGSDGILLGPLPVDSPLVGDGPAFGLRIFNPDGSEAEKSGNGLRIFARALWDRGLVPHDPGRPDASLPFRIHTLGGLVTACVFEDGAMVRVEMGRATFDSRRIPVSGPPREVLDETLEISGETLRYCAVSLGNPHCVILCDQTSETLARRFGPQVETEPRFPNRTNVQFMQVLDWNTVAIHIWERGAGYTLASGSSSCAAAAAAHRLGLCGSRISVQNPGGQIQVEIGPEYAITMTGPVQRVYSGAWEAGPC